MTDNPKIPDPGTRDPLASLVRAGGPRAVPSPERAARARVAVEADWRAAVGNRRTRRWRWAAAATVAAAASGLGLLALLQPRVAPAVASVTRVSGEVVRRAAPDGASAMLLSGHALYSGDQIETSAGRALVRWSESATLRIDSASLVRLESDREIRLMRGTLYLEMPNRADAHMPLAVSTRFGEVRHVGTRFEVQVGRDQVRVRVRDGIAIFAGNAFAAPVVIEAGRELSVAGGKLTLQPGPGAADPAWDWTQKIAPPFAIEGRSLFDALKWLGHEAGLRVIYASPAVRDRTRTVVLHGSIDGLDLRQALTAVLSGSGVSFELRSDRIEVRESDRR